MSIRRGFIPIFSLLAVAAILAAVDLYLYSHKSTSAQLQYQIPNNTYQSTLAADGTSNGKIYHNDLLKIELIVPPRWSIPSSIQNRSPEFYSICAVHDGNVYQNCVYHVSVTTGSYNSISSNVKGTEVLTDIVPNARVVLDERDFGDQPFQYAIIFDKEERIVYVNSNNKEVESLLLPTIKLLPIETGFKTYSNKKYDFEIQYPANYGVGYEDERALDDGSKVLAVTLITPDQANCELFCNGVITFTVDNPPTSISTFLKQSIDSLTNRNIDGGDSRLLTLQSQSKLSAQYPTYKLNFKEGTTIIYVFTKDHVYEISGDVPESVVDLMYRSLKLL